MISIVFHVKTINEFPQYKHCWAACDRYALAIGFTENGSNFFLPQTSVFNSQFPNDFKTIKDNSITAVDFPIHDYIVSWIMKLTCSTEPWCFRLYILLYSIIGLFFLYRITTLFTDSLFKSLAVVLFAASSPVLLYYQAGFLPTIPSLANSLIGLFFFFKFFKTGIRKNYALAILFITLASLARLPFAMILVAIICLECLLYLKTKKLYRYNLLVIFMSIFTILNYYWYNDYLREEYGSLFLNHIFHANSFSELIDFIVSIYQRWFLEYFTYIHYILIGLLGICFLYLYFKKKIKMSFVEHQLLLFLSILFLGCCLYFLLMSFQFIHHDYYFLDTFYIPMLFLFLFLVIKLPDLTNKKWQMAIEAILLLLFIPALLAAKRIHTNERNSDFYKTETTTFDNFKDAESLLKAINVPIDAKILVIAPDGPNNPFLLMKRKGYVVMSPNPETIEIALGWPYDFVIIENAKLIHSVYNYYPDILSKLSKVASNEQISIFTKKIDNEKTDLDAFFNLNTKQAIRHDFVNFDTLIESDIHVDSLSSLYHSGKKSGFSDATNQYGFSINVKPFKQLNLSSCILKVKSYFYTEKQLQDVLLCVSIKSKDKDILFLANDFSQRIPTNAWAQHEFIFYLPHVSEKDYQLSVFLWNRGKNNIFYDDFDLTIY